MVSIQSPTEQASLIVEIYNQTELIYTVQQSVSGLWIRSRPRRDAGRMEREAEANTLNLLLERMYHFLSWDFWQLWGDCFHRWPSAHTRHAPLQGRLDAHRLVAQCRSALQVFVLIH